MWVLLIRLLHPRVCRRAVLHPLSRAAASASSCACCCASRRCSAARCTESALASIFPSSRPLGLRRNALLDGEGHGDAGGVLVSWSAVVSFRTPSNLLQWCYNGCLRESQNTCTRGFFTVYFSIFRCCHHRARDHVAYARAAVSSRRTSPGTSRRPSAAAPRSSRH